MIMNLLGKTLVLVQVALSLVLLSWGVAVFAYPVDLGWKEPRRAWVDAPEGKSGNERIASEIDKRAAAVKKAVEAKHRALARVEQAQKAVAAVQHKFWQLHLAYNNVLVQLRQANADIPIREIRFAKDKGVPELDAKEPTGLAYDKAVPDADKSFEKYLQVLKDRHQSIKMTQESIAKILEEEKKITLYLAGKDANDKQVNPGIYGLLEQEAAMQTQLKEEYDYLQPLWVRELNAAQILMQRHARLEKRVKELEKP